VAVVAPLQYGELPIDLRMLPFRLIYHPKYDLNLGDHVFPSQKYRWLRGRFIRSCFASEEDFVAPEPASDEDVLLVHDPAWVTKLKKGTLSYQEILRLEIPYSRQMVEAFWYAAGGTILTARLALETGFAYHVGGGFHHAFREHGEGFCAINDVAIAIRRLQKDGAIHRAMVIDCDVHHGNGTAAVFAGDDSVYTFSMQQLNNYPAEKPPSSLEIHLKDRTDDQEYLERLENGVKAALAMFRPELIVYLAGADPFYEDQLGGLSLSFQGLRNRDQFVIETALAEKIPVATVLAGGYAVNPEDTVTIHANTAAVAKEVLLRRAASG
jgi:acetoin utilization deacetylase AcuC-like enzyme